MSKSQNNSLPDKTPFFYGVTNPKWLSIKAQYFFVFLGIASYFPFIVPFYSWLGLTTPQIGLAEFMNVLFSVISWPIVGSIADKSRRHSLALAICTIGFLVPITCLSLFSPSIPEQHQARLFSFKANTFELEVCSSKAAGLLSNVTSIFASSESNRTAKHRLVCKDLNSEKITPLRFQSQWNHNNCSIFLLSFDDENFHNSSELATCNLEFSNEASDNSLTFALVCLLRSLNAITLEPSLSLTDTIAYDMLTPQYRSLWGQQRMFATLGWGIGAGLIGLALDYLQTFRICFISLGIFSAGTVFIALFWLPRRLSQAGKGADQKKVPYCKALRGVLISPIFCINCAVAVASGMLLSVFHVAWPQHMGELGAPKILFGLGAVVIAAFEIPSLFFAGAIVNKIGEPACFLLMFMAYAIRIGSNAFLTPTTLWAALPIEGLHLFCFGLFFAAATRTADIIAPPGTQSTVQAFVATSYGGIGTGLGVLLVSFIYQTYGRHIAFLIFASFAVFCFIVFLMVYFVYLRKAMTEILKESTQTVNEETEKLGEITTLNPE